MKTKHSILPTQSTWKCSAITEWNHHVWNVCSVIAWAVLRVRQYLRTARGVLCRRGYLCLCKPVSDTSMLLESVQDNFIPARWRKVCGTLVTGRSRANVQTLCRCITRNAIERSTLATKHRNQGVPLRAPTQYRRPDGNNRGCLKRYEFFHRRNLRWHRC